jgi:hypothetical protein
MLATPEGRVELRQEAQAKTVGASVVVLIGPNPRRWALIISGPTNVGGAWVNVLPAADPTSNVGLTIPALTLPFVLTRADWG